MQFWLLWRYAEDLGLRQGNQWTDEGHVLGSKRISTEMSTITSLERILRDCDAKDREACALALIHRLTFPPDKPPTVLHSPCMLYMLRVSTYGDRHDWDIRWYWGHLRPEVLAHALCLAGVLTSNAWRYGA